MPVFPGWRSLVQNLHRFLNILRNRMIAWLQILETLDDDSDDDDNDYDDGGHDDDNDCDIKIPFPCFPLTFYFWLHRSFDSTENRVKTNVLPSTLKSSLKGSLCNTVLYCTVLYCTVFYLKADETFTKVQMCCSVLHLILTEFILWL